MAPRERRITEEKTQRIAKLLSETEMTVSEIAARMQCSRSVVNAINRKWKVRVSDHRRSKKSPPDL
jgi:transposase-like protein